MTPTDPPPYQEIDEAAQNRSLSSKTLEQPIGPVYMHYVVFAEDEPMESRRPIYDNDRSMGRILVKSVPPPHTVRTISRVLRRIEGFNASDASQLFVPLSNRVPEEDSTYVNLSGHSPSVGLLSVGQPLALVVHSEASLRSKERVETSSELLETCNINYVHYRLYSEEGALVSKRSFKEGDPSLGRLNILSIRPPHTVWTLRKRIAKVEDLDPSGLQILADIFSETAGRHRVKRWLVYVVLSMRLPHWREW
ncbi:hypothetical protein K443DRAFT_371199 [Laccaria amethystina LaAM-08-1]|uniref:Uncharacterized protein n=1 Tax=Laccaria amethystina LaAM-08-1 TaxID=1095629 RepID=A0A0C9WJ42_9AGAR|nr:hypothetical protein K443DRAFT_371199 [Laccaria amethystina LaAM-08-1]